MADILIKGLALPKKGEYDLELKIDKDGNVKGYQQVGCMLRQIDVTAIELPPHGRLIDAEPIEKEVKTWTSAGLDKYDFLYELDHADTIVEASNGSDN